MDLQERGLWAGRAFSRCCWKPQPWPEQNQGQVGKMSTNLGFHANRVTCTEPPGKGLVPRLWHPAIPSSWHYPRQGWCWGLWLLLPDHWGMALCQNSAPETPAHPLQRAVIDWQQGMYTINCEKSDYFAYFWQFCELKWRQNAVNYFETVVSWLCWDEAVPGQGFVLGRTHWISGWVWGSQQGLFFLSVLGELQQIEVCESVHNPAWSDWAVSLALGTLFALLPVVVHLLYLRNKCWNHIWDTLPPLHHGLADHSQPLLGGFVFWGFFLTCYYYHENISRPQGRWGKKISLKTAIILSKIF